MQKATYCIGSIEGQLIYETHYLTVKDGISKSGSKQAAKRAK